MNDRELLLRLAALALLLYALANWAASGLQLQKAREQEQSMQAQLEALRREEKALTERLAAADSEEEKIRLARERLGLVFPGEIVFLFPERGAVPGEQHTDREGLEHGLGNR